MTTLEDHSAQNKVPIGEALVVGAGIAGMQAALDQAEAGIRVTLLDRAPAIGGTMAMLDKTFPTNDCAMCIMSPKLVEVGRHLNIELLTNAEVEQIDGEAGDLTITIRQYPRYVDLEKCTGCGDCAAACPIERPDDFNGRLSQRKAIYKLYQQAIPNAYAIEKLGSAPCQEACPIHQRAQGYLALVAEGRFADAYRTILEENPFPSICGRVCNHVCEQACNRSQIDAPVNIMAVKRFVADWAWEHPDLLSNQPPATQEAQGALTGKRVAIIGSGPAGLTCAQDLVRQGCQVTVYEALAVAGGMMRVGVPVYRLPPEVVQREIDAILEQGVELKLNTRVKEVEALLQTYDAVFVAIGAHAGVRLPIPGYDLPQVLLATDFLRQVNLAFANHSPERAELDSLRAEIEGKRVLVLGGGNVAIDAAMTARRLGAAWVGMTCLEGREQMPAHEWEIQQALEEGIQIFPGQTFKEIVSQDGQVSGVRTVNVNFRGFIDGRPDFDEYPETETILPADVVIFAVGQRPESDCLQQVQRLRGGRVVVDAETQATNVVGIFAGGDVVTGAGAIVDAIAAGHRAAQSIGDYLLGKERATQKREHPVARWDELPSQTREQLLQNLASGKTSPAPRQEVPESLPAERVNDFQEMCRVFSEAEAQAEALRCLRCGICSECNQCVYACQAGAIVHHEQERLIKLKVGAVIFTPGLEAIPGEVAPEFGFGRYPNVVTSLQFERMLSASGPFGGVIQRPSDGAHPRKVAWIQCVGSRANPEAYPQETCLVSQGLATAGTSVADKKKVLPAAYCSAVCCMYATKEAMIAREHDENIQPTIFYIDMRSFGKGFETYFSRAQEEHAIRYIRCMVSSIKEVSGTHNLRLSYVTWEAESRHMQTHEEEFELVVLSMGLRPSSTTQEMAERLGVKLNEFGFAKTDEFTPTQSSRPGVFVAGTFTEPKDIPEAVVEASCAAAQVSALLKPARGSLTRSPAYPPERDVSDEPPRVGVFICHCGINIGSVVQIQEVVEYARQLPGVVYAEHNLYTCSQDTQERIRQQIEAYGLNRVVVASCTPRTHEPLFQDTLRMAGLNGYLFEMANIREQDSWVHRSYPQEATEKAKRLVAMAVAKSTRLRAITRNTFDVEQRALVIGGGLAGMTAALSIARQGFAVFLVERKSELGGNLRHIFTAAPQAEDPQKLLADTIAAVRSEPLINVLTHAEVQAVSGYTGQYRSTVRLNDGSQVELAHGVILVATGGIEITPHEYLYGQHERVITQRQLEQHLCNPVFAESLAGQTLVMIQCVGSRDEEHPYCSRVCCTQALKNALAIKKKTPSAKILVLYRDMRSYGFREQLYRQARQAGVIFLEYSETDKPQVTPAQGGALNLFVAVQPERSLLSLNTDWVILSAGIAPEPGNHRLAQLLKVPLNSDGFFLEAHVKLRPVDFAAEGIFLAGLAHSPRSLSETITQAHAAAVRAVALLNKQKLQAAPIIASVNPKLCAACGICVEVCPYGARVLEPGMAYAEVIEVLCQGCGACVAACPNKASQQNGFRFDQIFEMLEAVI